MDELIKSILKLIDEVHDLTGAVKSLIPIPNDINDYDLSKEDEAEITTYLNGDKIAE